MQKQYEIYAVKFPKTGTHTIHGVRPAVVFFKKMQNSLDIITMVPITSNQNLIQDPSRVKVGNHPENGLRELSVLQPEQITTVDVSRLGPKIGVLTEDQSRGLRISLFG